MCADETVERYGRVSPADARTYLLLPFDVPPGTQRVEVGYAWAGISPVPETRLDQTVFDLGLWDERGHRSPQGFRGWSGSRHGKLHEGQGPVHVSGASATRGYLPGRIGPGTWHVELGVAAVGPAGATWRVEITCSRDGDGADPPPPDPVDPAHVARAAPGWYHGDFHMHGFHSHPQAPGWDGFAEHARAAGLDFLPVTEYVTTRHWSELGALQRANPDLLVWPGREIITYYGHAVTLGETPGVVEYRHGHEDITLGAVQREAVAEGALFQVAHPTTFPGARYEHFCRGCEFTLGDEIDWSLVDTIEVLTGPVVVIAAEPGETGASGARQNPFTQPAIDLWEELLLAGHKITAVSGSDDKLGPGLGSSATAVHARELSRAGLEEGVRAGHAYLRTRGVHASPALELRAEAAGGQAGTFGDTFRGERLAVEVRVTGGAGDELRAYRNGRLEEVHPVASDDVTFSFVVTPGPDEGPLGTFWRVETADALSLTTLGNPVFLRPV